MVKKKKKRYANYLKDKNHLVAVSASANRRKGAKGPDEWLPGMNICWYIHSWKKIKDKWKLNYKVMEEVIINTELMKCKE